MKRWREGEERRGRREERWEGEKERHARREKQQKGCPRSPKGGARSQPRRTGGGWSYLKRGDPPWPRLQNPRIVLDVSAEFFFWFVWFRGPTFGQSTITKRSPFSKTVQNLENPTRCRQSDRFVAFWEARLASILSMFHNCQKTHILQHV